MTGTTPLADGRIVRDLASGSGFTAVLFYRPSDCVGCLNTLDEWRSLQRAGALRLLVVLDRQPTDEERQHLRSQRIEFAAVYDRPLFLPALEGPLELLLDSGGNVVAGPSPPGLGPANRALAFARDSLRPQSRGQTIP